MIATVPGELIVAISAVLVTAALGLIAYFARSWANGLSDDIGELKGEVHDLRAKVDQAGQDLSAIKVIVGWPPGTMAQTRVGRGR